MYKATITIGIATNTSYSNTFAVKYIPTIALRDSLKSLFIYEDYSEKWQAIYPLGAYEIILKMSELSGWGQEANMKKKLNNPILCSQYLCPLRRQATILSNPFQT